MHRQLRRVAGGLFSSSAALTLLGTGQADAGPIGTLGQTLHVPVSDVVNYSGLGDYSVVGLVKITVPPNPIVPPNPVVPPNPIRITATLLNMSVTSVADGTTCTATGTATLSTTVATGTLFGSYRYPNDPCRDRLGTLSIRYLLSTSETGKVTATAEALGSDSGTTF